MRYFAIDLSKGVSFHVSGKSINSEPLRHLARTLLDYEIFLGISGELYLTQNQEFCVRKGEVLVHNKGEFQTGTKAAPCSFYWLHFDGAVQIYEKEEDARQACQDKKQWIFFSEYFVLSNIERILPILSQLNHRCFEKGGEKVRNALAAAVLAELSEQYLCGVSQYAEDKRFAEILGWVHLYYYKDFTVSSLAERFAYNPKYLSFLFRKYTGQTVKGYIIQKRLEGAKALLAQSGESVKTVAKRVGFADEYYFMRVFKKDTGITPSEYRKVLGGCHYS